VDGGAAGSPGASGGSFDRDGGLGSSGADEVVCGSSDGGAGGRGGAWRFRGGAGPVPRRRHRVFGCR